MKAPGRKARLKARPTARRPAKHVRRRLGAAGKKPGGTVASLKRELAEVREQQAATTDVLNAIGDSKRDLQGVFETVLANGTRICHANFGTLWLIEGTAARCVAMHNAPNAFAELRRREPVIYPGPTNALGRMMKSARTVHIEDLKAERIYAEGDAIRLANADLAGARTILAVPMLKDGLVIGAIGIFHQQVSPFSDRQIALVENFAAQAVIAIENARLLSELRQRTGDLSESLGQQTAISEILRVISNSPSDVQPVLDSVAEHAARICEAEVVDIILSDGGMLRVGAGFGQMGRPHGETMPLDRGTVMGRSICDMKPVQVDDLMNAGEEFPLGSQLAIRFGHRTILSVPLVREDRALGAILVRRTDVRPFDAKDISLLTTFADQAAIAIENVRLFNELKTRTDDLTESLEYQTATGEILGVISRSLTEAQPVFEIIAASALRLCNATWSAVSLFNGEEIEIASIHNLSDFFGADTIRRSFPRKPSRTGATDRAVSGREVCYIPDVLAMADYDHPDLARDGGFRSILAVPMIREGQTAGAITVVSAVADAFTDRQIGLLRTFADQAVIAIENVRLFDEIQDKSRQLAEASQHKSQFLANMSHELRTPLNAILGYTELIQDSVYGEPPEKMKAVLQRISKNGQHLLGLINDVLDLSKIEAGQLVLTLDNYSMKDVVHGVYGAVETLAASKRLGFKVDMPPNLPAGRGDERRLTQVLLNLVGNAIKFTDQGEVTIKASAENGDFTLAVRDTGPGISENDQKKLFQEFQQADNSITKAKGGTGLGLAISRRIIEMHGGRIWVESRPGQGSTFSLTLPIKVEQARQP